MEKVLDMIWFILMLSIVCSSSAHVALKLGAQELKALALPPGMVPLAMAVLSNGWLWAGVVLHGLALGTWVYSLARVQLSIAYSFIALGYVLIALASVLIFHEAMSPGRIVGMVLVVSGVLLITRT